MEFYLEALDHQERMEGENAPIGIIICREKNKTVVEYALRTAGRPIGVATYTVVPELPEATRGARSSPAVNRQPSTANRQPSTVKASARCTWVV